MSDAAASTKVEVVRNDLEDRFEIHVGDHLAGFTQYRERGDRRIFIHTEIAEEFGGRGLGGVLAERAVGETLAEGKRIVPICPFIAAWLKKHPEHDGQVLWAEAPAGEPAP